jgi:drug/metabolite transporter (DMT)-like permease
MNKKKIISSALFSTLFVASVFLAVYLKQYVVLFAILAVIFSILAIISILWRKPDNAQQNFSRKKQAITAVMALAVILLLMFCVFLILYLLGKESLDWYISVIGIVANAALLLSCILTTNQLQA